ncbi:ABC transporter ATP-binding protein [Paenibacillus sp. FSL H8-0548]|uniref:ABC transporter ATP-binding protein n=1 Tax=Paenibacillus sp. FSL H8-0548 TaxID=1920422 RepID=UPI00096D4387|nr:ABC transporter ATP-binding protein [Paenibacillus sp. FSL H8-0548]OMF30076.1 ABC transporter ATP-binding protein [Paenibacillus sp. FSL H8-0548]
MASIQLLNITKSFDKQDVIKDLNLTIEDGKFTVLVGPSGCGKTTLLRMIAGLDPQTSGQVLINGQDVSKTAPGKRGVAMVFQNYAIYPTMSVRENIEFGLKNNGVQKAVRKELVESISSTVGLYEYLDRKPSTLSGGQRQRVALARAMVKQPSVFLMDEPLSNLDAKLRVQMRIELIELHKKLGTTFVYVTHDQVEAMSMADNIVLMNKGLIQQEAPPEVMYHKPSNQFTAQFIGVPPMNIEELPGQKLTFGFRPESAELSYEPSTHLFSIRGVIATREMLGSETIYQVKAESYSFMIKCVEDHFVVDDQVFIGVPAAKLNFFDKDELRIDQQSEAHARGLEILRGRFHG